MEPGEIKIGYPNFNKEYKVVYKDMKWIG